MIYIPEPWDQTIEEAARLSLTEYWAGYAQLTEDQINKEIDNIYNILSEKYSYSYVRKLFQDDKFKKERDILISLCVQLNAYEWIKTNKFQAKGGPKHSILGINFARKNLKRIK